jgi:glutamate-1-semialdehyde 2,1-aminomutase
VGSWGPLLFGHAPEFVIEAVQQAAIDGTSYGAPTEREVQMAELICDMVPSIEKLRFVSSGSEATASAIRLARGFTNRNKIVKCAGCYHGSVDSLLVKAGSGVATLGLPETAGVPDSLAAETIVVSYNSADELEHAFASFGDEVAAFIVEPIAGNMGLVLPQSGYLERARELTREAGALLIFDEVITGFRVAAGGAQEMLGISPDLTCLGKILGGGMPVGAYGGRVDIMDHLAPLGPVYQAGTLSGNPVAMAAGLAMLGEIRRRGAALYEELRKSGNRLAGGLGELFAEARIPVQVSHAGSLLTVFFSRERITSYEVAARCDAKLYARWFHAMLDRAVYLAPSQFECAFVSATHDEAVIKETLEAAGEALREIGAGHVKG